MGIAADIALILVVALIGGMVAQRLGQPLIIGYITAGILVGPYTAGPTVTEIHDIEVLAEIGVALLLFALGLEFNFKKLAKVKWIAFVGTPIQIGLSMLVGWWVATLLGWNSTAALWAGGIMALSSTMVILKTLSAQGELGSLASRIMISMLIIQDLAVVPLMLILPELNQLESGMTNLLWAGLRAAIFLVAMVVVGTRVMPYLLRRISQWGSRELFLVAITAIGLGIGYGTYLAGLSFAFGAFVAGMVLSESEYSHQALSDIVPLRDIFSMIFFVSVGMLINPLFLWQNAVTIVAFVGIVIVSKALIFGGITRLFGYRGDVPLTVALGLFQIGEFAFVLARVALDKGMLDSNQYNLVLATALVTMMMTPSMMRLRGPLSALQQRLWPDPVPFVHTEVPDSALQNHAIIVGYGRVGQYTAQLLQRLNLPFVVVESDQYRLDELQKQGVPVIYGDGASAEVLHAAGIQHARLVLIAVGSAFDVESIARRARELAPAVHIVARAAKMTQIEVLRELGIHEVVQPEFEAGLEMMRQTLLHFDVAADRIEQLSDEVRSAAYVPISSPHMQTSLLSSMAQTRIGLALHWYTMSAETPIVNVSLEQSRIREQSGVLVIAVIKNGDVQLTPSAQTVLEVGDIVAVCGTPAQRQAFEVLIKQPLSAYVLAATRE
ncbi:MAG: cation:proton antiporter [Chloroflexota bacterium]|jgi:CPA2 family monovalent cation:H+ antiporter-2